MFIKKGTRIFIGLLFVLNSISFNAFALDVAISKAAILSQRSPYGERLLCYASGGIAQVGAVLGKDANEYSVRKFKSSNYAGSEAKKKFKQVYSAALASCQRKVRQSPHRFNAPSKVNYDGLSPVAPFMVRPFVKDFPSTRWFDHRLYESIPTVPSPNWAMTYSGEFSSDLSRSATSYQYSLSGGTTLNSVAHGEVISISKYNTGKCTDKTRIFQTFSIKILHRLTPSIAYTSQIYPVSQVQVRKGQAVAAGQVIGSAGFVNCSPATGLTVAIRRNVQTTKSYPVDPYGWVGSFVDPHYTSTGVTLYPLWLPGQTPGLFREANADLAKVSTPSVSKVRFMSVRDDFAPNNEFIEVKFGTAASSSPVDIAGYKLVINGAVSFVFPSGSVLTRGASMRVYVGAPAPDITGFFLNSVSPLLGSANKDYCVRLLRSDNAKLGKVLGSSGLCS